MFYLITNRKIVKNGTLVNVIEKSVKGGINGIILREKDLTYEELKPIALRIKEIVRGKNVLFIVNNSLEVARYIKADGYHVGFHQFINMKPSFQGMIGVSVHSLDEAVKAEENGASYILASHIYETDCKKGLRPKGLDFIKKIKEQVKIPVIALGGIKPNNVDKIYEAGADGFAVMSYVMAAEDPYLAVKQFKVCIK